MRDYKSSTKVFKMGVKIILDLSSWANSKKKQKTKNLRESA